MGSVSEDAFCLVTARTTMGQSNQFDGFERDWPFCFLLLHFKFLLTLLHLEMKVIQSVTKVDATSQPLP